MDSIAVGTIFLLLLGSLTASLGVANAGYNYNKAPSNLNKILKAVLVHESTGHGLHSGSIANHGHNFAKQTGYSAGQNLNSGYSYTASQQMNANLGASDLTTIRVFHDTNGNTGGNIQPQEFRKPQATIVNLGSGYSPPPQNFQFTHEVAPTESRSESFTFSPNTGDTGFHFQNSGEQGGNAEQFFGTPRQADSGGGGAENGGYQYQQTVNSGYLGPVQILNKGSIGTEAALSSTQTGYEYSSPVQAPNVGYTNEQSSGRVLNNGNQGYHYQSSRSMGYFYNNANVQKAATQGYFYENPIQSQNIVFEDGKEAFRNDGHQSEVNAGFEQPRHSSNNGLDASYYMLQQPTSSESIFRGHSNLALPSTVKDNGYQYESPRPSQPEGYRYDKPDMSNRPETVFKGQPYLPLSPVVNDNGYRYDKPEQSNRPETVFKGQPPAVKDSGYQYETPRPSQPDGYRYDKPDISSRPETVFKGQPYLPLSPAVKDNGYQYESSRPSQPDGYRYDKPDISSRPETGFKGQPYLPLSPAVNDNGYRYDKPEQSNRPETVFKGQPYLPTTPVSGGW